MITPPNSINDELPSDQKKEVIEPKEIENSKETSPKPYFKQEFIEKIWTTPSKYVKLLEELQNELIRLNPDMKTKLDFQLFKIHSKYTKKVVKTLI